MAETISNRQDDMGFPERRISIPGEGFPPDSDDGFDADAVDLHISKLKASRAGVLLVRRFWTGKH
ncbi:hypothetical protein [Bifidobacterium callitrichidarum]|uniref:hypothetical protein n=1 Tax=Bifidobacterium callitrichidarum TaxID=2052941 RepID=UPI001304D8C5|nr:hypothetical protein [Bifidobacterium callitrichidarum]